MSQLNTDLEANLFTERQNLTMNNRTNDDTHLLNPSSESSGEVPQSEGATIGNSSLLFNFVALFIPVPKILATLFVLSTSDYQCIGVKQIWLFCMIGHDLLHTYIINLRIRHIVAKARLNTIPTQGPEQHQHNDSNQGIQLTAIQHEDVNQTQAQSSGDIEDPRSRAQINAANQQSSHVLEQKAVITRLTTLCIYFWVFLFFFWLEKDAISQSTGCDSTEVDDLISTYIFIGWLWLLNPLLICMGGCLCVPLIIIFVCLFRKKEQKSASKNDLKKLIVKEYSSDIPGNKECAICIVDYQEGDKIVQLTCSTMHHFHEDCAKSWLKINGLCPICRTRLGEKKANDTSVNA